MSFEPQAVSDVALNDDAKQKAVVDYERATRPADMRSRDHVRVYLGRK